MIDCSIVIAPDAAMEDVIRGHIASQPQFDSINHTDHQPLTEAPISVSIEVKRTGEGWQQARVQCAVWATAHFSRLKLLVKDVGEAQSLERQERQQQQQQQPVPLLAENMGNMAIRSANTAPSAVPEAGMSASTPASTAEAATPSSTAATDDPSSATGVSTLESGNGPSEPTMIPFLPLIIVQGHDWHFLAATLSPTGTVSRLFFFLFLFDRLCCAPLPPTAPPRPPPLPPLLSVSPATVVLPYSEA
jgi:hypothetical protein